jgi:hypothetical protein
MLTFAPDVLGKIADLGILLQSVTRLYEEAIGDPKCLQIPEILSNPTENGLSSANPRW